MRLMLSHSLSHKEPLQQLVVSQLIFALLVVHRKLGGSQRPDHPESCCDNKMCTVYCVLRMLLWYNQWLWVNWGEKSKEFRKLSLIILAASWMLMDIETLLLFKINLVATLQHSALPNQSSVRYFLLTGAWHRKIHYFQFLSVFVSAVQVLMNAHPLKIISMSLWFFRLCSQEWCGTAKLSCIQVQTSSLVKRNPGIIHPFPYSICIWKLGLILCTAT